MNNSEKNRKRSLVKISLARFLSERSEDTLRSKASHFCTWKRVCVVILFISVLILTCVLMVKYLHVETDSVCYPRVGCFVVSGAWSDRPGIFNFFPQSPNIINTTLIITSRNDSTGNYGEIVLPSQSIDNLKLVSWGKKDVVFFLIHGYTDDSTTWMQNLKRVLLDLGDVTVILVDWRSGASGYYPQVVANTRVVAREISRFINQFSRPNAFNLSSLRIHLIGHSLGSHVSSYVGKAFQESGTVFQITALDPAFPLFEGLSPKIRLHREDATTVLVLHSNTGPWGLGMKDPVGSIDIYLNNGRDQRGCLALNTVLPEPVISETKRLNLDSITNAVKDLLACSHRRAYEVLEDILLSFRNDSRSRTLFAAFPIDIKDNNDPIQKIVEYSFCRKGENCWNFYFNAEDSFISLPEMVANGSSFLMPTTDSSPFCVRFALLEVKLRPPVQSSSSFVHSLLNYEIAISYDAFGQELEIYRGKTLDISFLEAWVEFPCGNLVAKETKELKVTVSFTALVKQGNASDVIEDSRVISKLYWEHARLRFYDVEKNKIFNEMFHPSRFEIGIPLDSCFKLVTNARKAKG